MSCVAGTLPLRLRRARPLLGTLVDIRVAASEAELAQRAIVAAFAEIAVVHRLMSFHEAASDLARLNRALPGELVAVDARTAEVLQCAESLRLESGGAFDCGVADALVAIGRRPSRQAVDGEASDESGAAAVGRRWVRRGAGRLDLDGIAKGYAVDRAVDVLRSLGVSSALVNAGGDLRHFGDEAALIRLREPSDPSRFVATIEVRDEALASSTSHGLGADARVHRDCALIDPRRGRPLGGGAGASVLAPRCMMADALTKVVLVTGDARHPVLEARGARVVLHRSAPAMPG